MYLIKRLFSHSYNNSIISNSNIYVPSIIKSSLFPKYDALSNKNFNQSSPNIYEKYKMDKLIKNVILNTQILDTQILDNEIEDYEIEDNNIPSELFIHNYIVFGGILGYFASMYLIYRLSK